MLYSNIREQPFNDQGGGGLNPGLYRKRNIQAQTPVQMFYISDKNSPTPRSFNGRTLISTFV